MYFVSSTFCILYSLFRYPPVFSDTGSCTLYLQHFVSCIHCLGILLYSLIQDPVLCIFNILYPVSNIVKKQSTFLQIIQVSCNVVNSPNCICYFLLACSCSTLLTIFVLMGRNGYYGTSFRGKSPPPQAFNKISLQLM